MGIEDALGEDDDEIGGGFELYRVGDESEPFCGKGRKSRVSKRARRYVMDAIATSQWDECSPVVMDRRGEMDRRRTV